MSSTTPETNVDAGAPADERASGFSLDIEEKIHRRRVPRTGSAGCGPVTRGPPSVLGLVVLAIIFSQVSDRFLSR